MRYAEALRLIIDGRAALGEGAGELLLSQNSSHQRADANSRAIGKLCYQAGTDRSAHVVEPRIRIYADSGRPA